MALKGLLFAQLQLYFFIRFMQNRSLTNSEFSRDSMSHESGKVTRVRNALE